jgi:hypothetical protein
MALKMCRVTLGVVASRSRECALDDRVREAIAASNTVVARLDRAIQYAAAYRSNH